MTSCLYKRTCLFAASVFVLLTTGAFAGPQDEGQKTHQGGLAFVPEQAVAVVELPRGMELIKRAGAEGEVMINVVASWLQAECKLITPVLLDKPVTMAMLPPSPAGEPSLLLVFSDNTPVVEKLLTTLCAGPEGIKPVGRMGGMELTAYTVPAPVGMQFYGMRRGAHYLLASTKELLQQAIAAESAPATKAILADTAITNALARHTTDDPLAIMLSFPAGMLKNNPDLAGLCAGAGRITWTAGFSATGTNEYLAMAWPGKRTGFAALPGQDRIPEELGSCLPVATLAGMVAHLDLTAPDDGAGPMLGLLPGLAGMGVFPWTELHESLSGSLAWGLGEDGKYVTALGLKDPTRAEQVLRQSRIADADITESTLAGYTVFSFITGKAAGISWTLADNRLLLANDTESLEMALSATEKPALPKADPVTGSMRIWGSWSAFADNIPATLTAYLPAPEKTFSLTAGSNPAGVKFRLAHETTPAMISFLGRCMPAIEAASVAKAAPLATPPASGGQAKKVQYPVAAPEAKVKSGFEWEQLTAAEKHQALITLEQSGNVADCAPEIINLLAVKNDAVVARAAYALGRAKAAGAAPALGKALTTSANTEVRRYCAYALMRVPDNRGEQALIAALADKDPTTVGFAATGLEVMASKKAGNALTRALARWRSGPDDLKVRLLRAIATLGVSQHAPRAMVSVSKQDQKKVLDALIYTLQELTPKFPRKKEVDFLCGMLDNPIIYVRRYAVERLGEIGARESLPFLERRAQQDKTTLAPRIRVVAEAIESNQGAGVVLKDAVDSTAGKLADFKQKAIKWVDGIKTWPTWKKAVLAGSPLLLVGLLLVLRRMAKNRAKQRTADQLAALVAPSDDTDYVEEGYDEEAVDQEVDLDAGEDFAAAEDAVEEEEPQLDYSENEEEFNLEDTEEMDAMFPTEEEEESFKE